MPKRSLTGERQPLTGWARLAWWAAGRAVVVAVAGAIGVIWLETATEQATAADQIAGTDALAGVMLAVAVSALASGALRLARLRRAARQPAGQTAGRVTVRNGRVRVQRGAGALDLEWKVLRFQRWPAGPATVHGPLASGGWLVVRVADRRLIWPATRAQPVIGTGTAPAPPTAGSEFAAVGAHRRLLAAYVQVINLLDTLPAHARVPLAEWEPSWWWIGAPRPLVGGLVAAHIRRRLRALGDAHVHAAVLTGPDDDDARSALREAGQECRELADTLRSRTWPAVAASVLSFGVPLYLTFYPQHLPGISARNLTQAAEAVALAFFLLATVPLVMLFRSILYQRALFRPAQRALSSRGLVGSRPPVVSDPGDWDVYQFEREAFSRAGTSEPWQWEDRPYVPWLVAACYALGVAVPFMAGKGGFLSGAYLLIVLFAFSRVFLSVLFYAIRDLTTPRKRESGGADVLSPE
jgi:hypothetical protein